MKEGGEEGGGGEGIRKLGDMGSEVGEGVAGEEGRVRTGVEMYGRGARSGKERGKKQGERGRGFVVEQEKRGREARGVERQREGGREEAVEEEFTATR